MIASKASDSEMSDPSQTMLQTASGWTEACQTTIMPPIPGFCNYPFGAYFAEFVLPLSGDDHFGMGHQIASPTMLINAGSSNARTTKVSTRTVATM